MPEEQTAIALLTNLTKDVGEIKTNLAVNTTKTGYIEDHLRTLNGKVAKQEEKQQQADTKRGELEDTVKTIISTKRRWNDNVISIIKQMAVFALGLVSAYIISKFFK